MARRAATPTRRAGLRSLLAALGWMVVAAAGCTPQAPRISVRDATPSRVVLADAGARLAICSGWGCKSRREVAIPHRQWQALARLFTPTAPSPAHERQRIAQAIARLEGIIGALAGTAGDLPGNRRGETLGGQLDCVDESTNSTTYLLALEAQGWLRWHRSAGRARRSWFVLDQHYTAVIEEREGGRRYAVDSWYGPNGAPPEIQPLSDWYLKRHPAPNAAGLQGPVEN